MYLLDTGASHCFIDETFAKYYGFARQPSQFNVQGALGIEQESTTKCHVRVKIQKYTCEIPCYVIDM